MKKKIWLYLTTMFTVFGIVFLVYSVYAVSPEHSTISVSQQAFIGSIEEYAHVNNLIITSLDPEDLDQAQTSMPGGLNIAIGSGSSGYGSWIMQSGYNDRYPFTGFQIGLAEHGTTTEPIYVGVMLGKLDPQDENNWAVIARLDPGVLPEKDTFYWLGLDLEDDPLSIGPGQNWYLLAISMDDPVDGNWWMWGCSDQQPYPRGTAMAFDGSNWHDMPYDMTFKVYTVEGGEPEEPEITITSNYQVVSQFLGSLSLLGAVVSGVKYFTVV